MKENESKRKYGKNALVALLMTSMLGSSVACKSLDYKKIYTNESRVKIKTNDVPPDTYKRINIQVVDPSKNDKPEVNKNLKGAELTTTETGEIDLNSIPDNALFKISYWTTDKNPAVDDPTFVNKYIVKKGDGDKPYMKALLGTVYTSASGEKDLGYLTGVTIYPLGGFTFKKRGLNEIMSSVGVDIGQIKPGSDSNIDGEIWYTGVSYGLWNNTLQMTLGAEHYKANDDNDFKTRFTGGFGLNLIDIIKPKK